MGLGCLSVHFLCLFKQKALQHPITCSTYNIFENDQNIQQMSELWMLEKRRKTGKTGRLVNERSSEASGQKIAKGPSIG